MFPGTKASKRGWDETADAYIRNRDGVIHVLSVRTGTVMPCYKCGYELKVPYMETGFIQCAYCKLKGRTSARAVVHFPLGDSLLDYLKKIDPVNPLSERLAEDIDRQNAALAATMENDALRAGNAAASDRYNRIVGIPQTGYTGKYFR